MRETKIYPPTKSKPTYRVVAWIGDKRISRTRHTLPEARECFQELEQNLADGFKMGMLTRNQSRDAMVTLERLHYEGMGRTLRATLAMRQEFEAKVLNGELRPAPALIHKRCPECFEWFDTPNNNKTFCKEACQGTAAHRRMRQRKNGTSRFC